jgi:hypothetical protein
VLVILAGCATPYGPRGWIGGYTEERIAANLYCVRFFGNGFTSPQRVGDFALLRATELCTEAGYPYFIIEDRRADVDVQAITTPGYAETTGSGTVSGRHFSYSSHTTYTPPATQYVYRHIGTLMIRRTSRNAEEEYPVDAKRLAESLRAKYGLKPPTSGRRYE